MFSRSAFRLTLLSEFRRVGIQKPSRPSERQPRKH